MSGIALILAGHGSHISPNTAGIVWACVDRLRQLGIADEVTACFWKESPALSAALDTVAADEVAIVPLFTARGYFTTQVLPAEMGLCGRITQRGARRIHLLPNIGEHPRLDAIVDARLRETMRRHELKGRETAIAVIGHGTRRNRQSQDTARQQAQRLREQGWASEVAAVYLDDEPDIPSIYRSSSAPNILALPYFLADGSHVSIDIPRALGIAGSGRAANAQGRSVFISDPVGDVGSLCDVILAIARDTGLPFEPRAVDGVWSGFPVAGRSALLDGLDNGGALRFGQVLVSRDCVWHGDDHGCSRAFTTPAALRQHIREGPFRSLDTSEDLPGCWHVDLDRPQDASAVLETVYPGLLADWAARQAGTLKTVSLQVLSQRQVGMFRGIHNLARELIEATISRVCGACIREPTWWHESVKTDEAMPCREACNHWLSAAKNAEGAL